MAKSTDSGVIISYEIILFPVHILKTHWALGVLDIQYREVRFLGSLMKPTTMELHVGYWIGSIRKFRISMIKKEQKV